LFLVIAEFRDSSLFMAVTFSSTVPPKLAIGDTYWAPAKITYMGSRWFEVDVVGEKSSDTTGMRIQYSEAHLVKFPEESE
jgi:hypothetical protein